MVHLKHLFKLKPPRNLVTINRLLLSTASASASASASVSSLVLLSHCNSIRDLQQIHAHLIRCGLAAHLSHLLSFCCTKLRTDFINYARHLLDEIPHPDSTLYNSLIRAYSHLNSPNAAVSLYLYMLASNFPPDDYTFPCLLKSLDRDTAVKFGYEIHAHAAKFGFGDNPYVQSSLICMYSLAGKTDTARVLFERSDRSNVVMWNAMISGYNRCKQYTEACELFRRLQREYVWPTVATLVSVLSACAKLRDLEFGSWVHGIIGDYSMIPSLKLCNALLEMYAGCGEMAAAWMIFEGMEVRDVVSWTSMVVGYANSGRIHQARTFFDQMHERDIVSWTAMIDGYVRAGQFKEALELFRALQRTDTCPDEFTVVSALTACAQLGALELGEWIRVYIERKKIKMDTYAGNALIDMYSKCGCVDAALEIFQKVPKRDKFAWTAIIVGLAINGHGEHALHLFSEMLRASVRPDEITFIGVLSACAHSCLVDQGREFFSSMTTTHGIKPTVTHYGCWVDLLGRAGRLQEALETIDNMPMKPNAAVWRSLLGACRVYKNVEIAEVASYRLLALDPQNGASYVLLSNIYAKCNKWDEARRVREMMMERGIRKEPGCSLIDMNGEVHEFVAGDRSHPRTADVYWKLEEMRRDLKLAGYVPDTSEVLLDVREEEKENAVFQHSEKLALAFGLLSSAPGATIRIVKNLRMCLDCHGAIKMVSRLYGREIIVRDRTRFHHFRDGSCSCKNFW